MTNNTFFRNCRGVKKTKEIPREPVNPHIPRNESPAQTAAIPCDNRNFLMLISTGRPRYIVTMKTSAIFTLALASLLTAAAYAADPPAYPDGRPAARWRMDAKDQGPVLRHGDGPNRCDYLGARDIWAYQVEGIEYTDAVWVYWTKDHNHWDARNKAIVLDGKNCTWSKKCIGLPSVLPVKNRLAILYDAPGGESKSHMQRDIGLAWLKLPLVPPQ